MNKFALGIHHFNLTYVAGQEETYHRQVREAINPFLNMLLDHPQWRMNVEIQGFAVEFIAQHYPGTLEKLQHLISESKQIELISCHYAPQIWVAFPKYDMLKSIQINDDVLEKHNLERSRIFFAQENFSGEGIQELSEYFDTCIMKEDYYYHCQGVQSPKPYFKMGEMRVVIGAAHILQRISKMVYPDLNATEQSEVADRFNILSPTIRAYVEKRRQQNVERDRSYSPEGAYDNIQWQWYHMGSSEHFAKHHVPPQDVWNCWFDPSWFALMEGALEELHASEGFELSTIGDFLSAVDASDYSPEPLRPILDGCWNMKSGNGVYQWMGFHANSYEADCFVRSHNWRTRARLIACECLLKQTKHSKQEADAFKRELQQAWRHQLLAEGSDSTGWWPTQKEVLHSVEESEAVANTVGRVTDLAKKNLGAGHLSVNCQNGKIAPFSQDLFPAAKEIDLSASFAEGIQVFGSRGQAALYQISEHMQRLSITLAPCDDKFGVSFKLNTDQIKYSPALEEDQVAAYALSEFKPDVIFLPLPNGLIALDSQTYLIKHNDTMHVACCIDKRKQQVRFQLEKTKMPHYWTLTLFKGTEEKALHLANSINVWPTVVI